MGSPPHWPSSMRRAAWARCAGEWALRLPAGHEDRCYVEFALEALAEAGARRALAELTRAATTGPHRGNRGDISTVRLASAKAAATLGDLRGARAQLAAVRALAQGIRDKDEAEELRARADELERTHCMASVDELAGAPAAIRAEAAYHMAARALRRGDRAAARAQLHAASSVAKRVGWSEPYAELLLDAGDRRGALALFRRPSRGSRLAALAPRDAQVRGALAAANRALAELTPDEWNLHMPAEELRDAHRQLVDLGAKRDAANVAARAVAAFGRGQLDARGFASGAAYVALAQMSFVEGGWPVARPYLERAFLVCRDRKDRRVVTPEAVRAAIQMRRFSEALVWAGASTELRAEVLFAARRTRELAQTLGAIARSPALAAKLAWRFASG